MRQPIQLIAGRSPSAIAVLAIALLTSCVIPFGAQQTAAAEESPVAEDSEEVQPSVAEQEPLSAMERQSLIVALGANSFAARENAAAEIMAVGAPLLPDLQTAVEKSRDPEVRLRASILYRRVATRDFETRAEQFLASETPGDLLPGWSAVVPVLGDHRATRELFVEISRSYPDLAKAYEGAPRERVVQAEKAAEAIIDSLTVEMRPPGPADALALLLVAGDPAVPVSRQVERTLLSMVRLASVKRIRAETTLESIYDDLLSGWIRRSGSQYRQEILWLTMEDNLPAGGALALRTLHEAHNPTTLQMALQTAARFAEPKDTPLIEDLLEDDRPAGDGVAFMTESGERIETRISDVAMAAIAVIYDESLEEIGFPYAREHPKVGFQVESLGFPLADKEARKRVRQRIDKLLAPEQR